MKIDDNKAHFQVFTQSKPMEEPKQLSNKLSVRVSDIDNLFNDQYNEILIDTFNGERQEEQTNRRHYIMFPIISI